MELSSIFRLPAPKQPRVDIIMGVDEGFYLKEEE